MEYRLVHMDNEQFNAEVFPDDELRSRLSEISDQLNDIKTDMRERNLSIEEVFARYQGMMEANIRSLVREMRNRGNSDRARMSKLYQSMINRIEEAHKYEKALYQEKIDEANLLREKAEKVAELKSAIYRIYVSNPDNAFLKSHSLITEDAKQIKNIQTDLKQKLLTDNEIEVIRRRSGGSVLILENLRNGLRDSGMKEEEIEAECETFRQIMRARSIVNRKFYITYYSPCIERLNQRIQTELLKNNRRRKRIQELYNHFKLFEDMFKRDDSKAKISHLEAINNWLALTEVDGEAVPFPLEELDILIKQCNEYIRLSIN